MISLMRSKQFMRYIWHRYATFNTGVTIVAVFVVLSWAWGAASTIQANFEAQKVVEERQRERDVLELEVATLRYRQNYYRSDEFKDLEARSKLGLASPGEKVLILPPNSERARQQDEQDQKLKAAAPAEKPASGSNFQQWINFLSGKSASRLQK